jgi:hypothetical protein
MNHVFVVVVVDEVMVAYLPKGQQGESHEGKADKESCMVSQAAAVSRSQRCCDLSVHGC